MSATTKFRGFISALTEQELEDFSRRCNTTPRYVLNHLYHAYKVPRREFMATLVLNSGGKLTRNDLLDHFYPADLFQSAA